jgi:hypothetical protein
MNEEKIKSPVDDVMDDLRDNRYLHLNQHDRVKYKFNLTHGKGKRKKNKKKKKG